MGREGLCLLVGHYRIWVVSSDFQDRLVAKTMIYIVCP